MSFFLFSAPEREPSQFVGFAGNRIDRQSENRTDEALEVALADPRLRIMQTRGGRLYLKLNGSGFDPYFTLAEAREMGAKLGDGVLLGLSEAGPVVMAPGAVEPDDLPEGIKAIDHRSVYVQGLIGPDMLGELAQGASLLAWNRNHRFCGRCGAETQARIGGYKRSCAACGAEHFPRTDPVAIMLTVRHDMCLLGRSRISRWACIRAWPASSNPAKRSKTPSAARRWRNQASASAALPTTPASHGRFRTR